MLKNIFKKNTDSTMLTGDELREEFEISEKIHKEWVLTQQRQIVAKAIEKACRRQRHIISKWGKRLAPTFEAVVYFRGGPIAEELEHELRQQGYGVLRLANDHDGKIVHDMRELRFWTYGYMILLV